MLRSPGKAGSDTEIISRRAKEKPSPNGRSNISSKIKRPKATMDDLEWQNEFKCFKEEVLKGLEGLKSDMITKFNKIEKSIEKTNTEIEKSMDFLSQKYEEVSQKLTDFELKMNAQRQHIYMLENKVEDLTRQAHSTLIEIRNVPTRERETKEDLRNYVNSISKTLKVEGLEVRDAYRWAIKKEGRQTIVAELNNVVSRYNLLKAAKTHNANHPNTKLSCQHLGMSNESGPVFLGEHLTQKARRLYYMGRQLLKDGKVRFCWPSNGRIYIRKSEESAAILLKDEEQLEAF